MEQDESATLAAVYVGQISGRNPADILGKKTADADKIIDGLVQKGLADAGGTALTEAGRASLKVVLAGGVFDIIHPGHIHTLNAAKKLGDVLVVVVATDSTAVKMKKRKPLHSQELRQELVESLVMVDLCIIGQEDDIFGTVNLVRPQVIALGYDQAHQEKFIREGCKRIGLDADVARLQSPVPESSSSKIQKEYGGSIHGI
ncbi:MAG: FAD synthase [Nitrosopumilus sp. H8]|nr:MAG: FAD synthase [Nitrosopumilus sp. H8]